MRIETLRLSWFRGAGPDVSLEPKGKSIACFGPNGSGKSTFVDALEYLASDGKIEHLSHEYAGKGQINGVRNTHAPASSPATIEVTFPRGETIAAKISAKGAVKIEAHDAAAAALDSWRGAQLILRQDEVARFIHATKGEKYSALLPLLGLGEVETVVDNLHRFAREVAKQGRLAELEAQVEGTANEGGLEGANATLQRLAEKYGAGGKGSINAADAIAAAIQRLLASLDDDARRRQRLEQVRDQKVGEKARVAHDAAAKVAEGWDRIVRGRVSALEGAEAVLAGAGKTTTLDCPSCGRPIPRKDLAAHVASELEILTQVRAQWRAWESAHASLSAALETIHGVAGAFDLAGEAEASPAAAELGTFAATAADVEKGDANQPNLEALAQLVERALRLDASVAAELASPAPTASDLLADGEALARARACLDRASAVHRLAGVQAITGALESLETAIRHDMRVEAERTLAEISAEVQRLWAMLHPGEPIEDVKLYAGDTDQAPDVSLKYYGHEQPSPRLTLSEGHRNSLGLCIFLALVRLRAPAERPIVLDDIISSLDREHRGRVISLLASDFADRQVLLFTHDHEWFAQLRVLLPAKDWSFRKLRPWDSPEVGVRWSGSLSLLDEAREQLDASPEIAASRARASMDEELQIAAEQLELRVPYLRGDRNDHRTGYELLTELASTAKKCLRTRSADDKAPSDAIAIWKDAAARLVTTGNLAAHGGAVSRGDAQSLIESCERAIAALRCTACGEAVWFANEAGKRRQCRCGEMVWKLA
jgi:energy-coupling factor transporter ATP-binding protein EcfA2